MDGEVGGHRGDGTDGLGNGAGFADTAGLDDDVVEALHLKQVFYLLDKVHLQCAADATVLEGYQGVVLLVDDTAFLDEVGVDVDFADIVDDDGKLDATLIGQNPVQQRGLTAAQIACQQQYGYFFHRHIVFLSFFFIFLSARGTDYS